MGHQEEAMQHHSYQMKMTVGLCLLVAGCMGLVHHPAALAADAQGISIPQKIDYQIQQIYDHPQNAYTQGLVYQKTPDGTEYLYESTGRAGLSELIRYRFIDGSPRLDLRKPLPDQVFGEGMTLWKGKLVVTTYTEGKAYFCSTETLDCGPAVPYDAEGWGLTNDASHLISSDGTARIVFRNPQDLTEVRSIQAHHGSSNTKALVQRLNELEYVKGKIYANVWLTDMVAVIDPKDGKIGQWVDFSGLPFYLSGIRLEKSADGKSNYYNVLNGIAYDQENDRFFVTGKLWDKLFEVTLTR